LHVSQVFASSENMEKFQEAKKLADEKYAEARKAWEEIQLGKVDPRI